MSAAIEYLVNKTSAGQIAEHLSRCDSDFVPPLSGRVEIETYSRKIASRAARFEAWSGGALVGLVAAYCNDLETGIAYITSVSVLREWTGKGVAADLMKRCVEYAKASGMREISLEVARDNSPAIKLYEASGFIADGTGAPFVRMKLNLED
jgi:ribosomal protein S18 acetylase RimI-like enzyme